MRPQKLVLCNLRNGTPFLTILDIIFQKAIIINFHIYDDWFSLELCSAQPTQLYTRVLIFVLVRFPSHYFQYIKDFPLVALITVAIVNNNAD